MQGLYYVMNSTDSTATPTYVNVTLIGSSGRRLLVRALPGAPVVAYCSCQDSLLCCHEHLARQAVQDAVLYVHAARWRGRSEQILGKHSRVLGAC